jgi:hypothetical protein
MSSFVNDLQLAAQSVFQNGNYYFGNIDFNTFYENLQDSLCPLKTSNYQPILEMLISACRVSFHDGLRKYEYYNASKWYILPDRILFEKLNISDIDVTLYKVLNFLSSYYIKLTYNKVCETCGSINCERCRPIKCKNCDSQILSDQCTYCEHKMILTKIRNLYEESTGILLNHENLIYITNYIIINKDVEKINIKTIADYVDNILDGVK